VFTWFRRQVEFRGGGNHQTMINQALCEHIHLRQAPFEELSRKILHEEISKMVQSIETTSSVGTKLALF
jgi:hypothetical protein